MRRPLAVMGAAGLVLAALPAQAQQVPQPQQSQQSQKVVTAEVVRPAEGDVVSGGVRIGGRGSSAAGVKSVTISIDRQVVAVAEPADLQQKVLAAYEWDSYFLPEASKIARNRAYTVTVEAVSTGDQVDRASAIVVVDNPPVAPTDVRASVKGQTVSLGWDPNPEPDLLGYAIERDSGKGFKEIDRTRRTGFSEDLVPGSYAYRVVAVRSSAGPDAAVTSPPSDPEAAVVSAPPPPKEEDGGALGGARGAPSKIGGAPALGNFFGGGSRGAQNPGLPSAPKPKVPSQANLKAPRPPKAAQDNRHEEWGKYKRKLPYEIEEAEPETHSTGMTRILDEVIPPDGARWVLIGVALVLVALVIAVMARRVKVPKAAPAAEPGTPSPA